MNQPALDRVIDQYAAKFAAETIASEPSGCVEPTDENLSRILGSCARPPKSGQLHAIRDVFLGEYGAKYRLDQIRRLCEEARSDNERLTPGEVLHIIESAS